MGRLAAGDAEALQLLYLELGPVVHGIIRRMLENSEDAREAVQDTFVKAWRQARTYRADRGEVVSWLVFIARRSAIDRMRKDARRRRLHDALRNEPIDFTVPAEADTGNGAGIADYLGQLSSTQRQALELAFFGGCTQSEIAATMKTPVGNVKNHLRRGLQKLRQLVLP